VSAGPEIAAVLRLKIVADPSDYLHFILGESSPARRGRAGCQCPRRHAAEHVQVRKGGQWGSPRGRRRCVVVPTAASLVNELVEAHKKFHFARVCVKVRARSLVATKYQI
jgi:hypothetical protein